MWELIVLAVVVVTTVTTYNALVRLRERLQAAWADIDVQLKRRYDLIPNLVETVRGYASHEREALEAVVAARNSAMSAQGPAEKGQAEEMLTGALKSLFALTEGYPELDAAGGFRDLQATLATVEESIQSARRYYNAVVRDFNTKVQQVPSNLVARTFGFRQADFFEVSEAETAAPRVDFNDG
jgi:LemA protein